VDDAPDIEIVERFRIPSKTRIRAIRARNPGKAKARRLTAVLVTFSLVLAGLLGEVVVRVLPPAFLPELNAVQPAQLDIGSFAKLSDNPRLYYELVPGNFEVNAAGYRGPEYPQEKPAGVKRIVSIGDSGAFGLGVSERDTFLRRLEALYSDSGHSEVQVINLAVSGYNSEQELEMLRTRGFAFEPDLVVLGYDHNDPAPLLGHPRPPMPENYGANPLHSELIRYVMRKMYTGPKLRINRRVDGYIATGSDWDRHMVALSEMCRLCREKGIPAIVVVYDMWVRPGNFKASRHYRSLHAPLITLWEQGGFDVLECYGFLQTRMYQEGWTDIKPLWVSVEPRDGHPNAEGHRLIADALYDQIESRALLQ
jgi:lysophospholipase L1-like esterase